MVGSQRMREPRFYTFTTGPDNLPTLEMKPGWHQRRSEDGHNFDMFLPPPLLSKTSQELRMLSSVTIN